MIRFLVTEYPDAVKEKNNDGETPLHLACYNKQSGQVIRFLVDKYPEAVEEKDRWEQMPLDLARGNNQPPSVIEMLKQATELAEARKELHELYSDGNWNGDRFEGLIRAYPELARDRDKDKDDFTPLHAACSGNQSEKVIRFLESMNIQRLSRK